ncbi:hypothetical protein D3C73_1438040 [compost metagenome]
MRHVAAFDLVRAQHVHRGQHLVRAQLSLAVLVHIDLAQGERGVGGLGECFRGEWGGRERGHQRGSLHREGGGRLEMKLYNISISPAI